MFLIICSLQKNYIRWPDGSRLKDVSDYFETEYGLPNCIGIIDGTHVYVQASWENADAYYNRKSHTTINNLVVVDHEGFITYLCGGRCTKYL